jgi:hypothetical protein
MMGGPERADIGKIFLRNFDRYLILLADAEKLKRIGGIKEAADDDVLDKDQASINFRR